VITHGPSGRKTTFGAVAEAASRITPPKDVPLKDPKTWKLIGKPIKRLDTTDKLTGKQIYGADFTLPGMLNATIKECPVFGGKVKSFDAAKVAGMKGVKKVVQVGDTAVRHRRYGGRRRPRLTHCRSSGRRRERQVSSASIADMLKAGLDADQAFVGNQGGARENRNRGAAKKSKLSTPIRIRIAAVDGERRARYTADKCEVWCRTQNVRPRFGNAAPGPAEVRDLQTASRRRFGRRGAFHDYVRQVSSRRCPAPVKRRRRT
jgi:isoquinoline 1-oxidoreductase beta subunit